MVHKAFFLEHTADDRCAFLDNDIVHRYPAEVVAIVEVFAIAESGKSIIKIVLAAFQRQRVAAICNLIRPAVALTKTV